MTYDAWEAGVPKAIRGDTLWRVEAYRLSLFLADLGWEDVTKLLGDERTRRVADQLYRAVGHISSNIAEGYSRSSGKARAVFYDYALGSARETRDWYYKVRRGLTQPVTDHRIELTSSITRLLLAMASTERRRTGNLSPRRGASD